MQSATQTAPVSKKTLWTGLVFSGLAVLFLLFDAVFKLTWRVGDPLFSHILFPVYMGLFIWGGLYFREERVRTLIPLRG